jgi:hypothetical protein
MAKFEVGNKISKGRPPGAINRSTEMMKLSVARATNKVLDSLPSIMEEMIKKDPKGAVDLAIKLLEFNMPKLSRTELKAEIDQKVQQISININKSGSNGSLEENK